MIQTRLELELLRAPHYTVLRRSSTCFVVVMLPSLPRPPANDWRMCLRTLCVVSDCALCALCATVCKPIHAT